MSAKAASIKSDKIQGLLARALEVGAPRDLSDLVDAIERASAYPSARPNHALAAAVGAELAARGTEGERMAHAFLADRSPYFVRIGIFFLAERAARAKTVDGGLAALGEIDVTQHEVRDAVADAVAHVLLVRPVEAADALASFTAGYLSATIAIDALTRPDVLTRLPDDRALLQRFAEAFDLADTSSRGDDRTQGCRLLRSSMPTYLARAARRFSGAVAFVRDRASVKRPESREIVRAAIDELRRSRIGDPEAARLLDELGKHAPPARDPTRIPPGTRRRSRGRRA